MTDITVIELWPPEFECIVCEQPCPGGYCFVMYEGEIVPDDAEEWGGFTCCKRCFDLNEGHVGEPIRPTEQRKISADA